LPELGCLATYRGYIPRVSIHYSCECIAIQLASKSFSLKCYICEAIKANSGVASQPPRDQWNQLILEPLSKLEADSAEPSQPSRTSITGCDALYEGIADDDDTYNGLDWSKYPGYAKAPHKKRQCTSWMWQHGYKIQHITPSPWLVGFFLCRSILGICETDPFCASSSK
jgi:hypothetical protein